MDTPFVLSRDFVISSQLQPPAVVDYAWIANKVVLDKVTIAYKNLVLVNTRMFDPFGLDWIYNSLGSQLYLQNVTFVDAICSATAEDVLQTVRSLPNVPGFPPNSISILPTEHCVPALPGSPGNSAAAPGQLCFSHAVHFAQLYVTRDGVGSGTGTRSSYSVRMQNVTRVCKEYIDKRCLQEHQNATLCWDLQAAQLGVQHWSQPDSKSDSSPADGQLDKKVIAGIAVGCAAAAALLAAMGYYCLLKCWRTSQPEPLLVASSGASGSHHSNASRSVRGRGAPSMGDGNSFVAAHQSTSTVVHDSYWSMDPNCNDNAKAGKQQLLAENSGQRHQDIKLGVLLGAGSFGRVYKGRWQGSDVAIKVIHCLPQEVNHVLREAEILMGVQHEHIVRCFKCCVVQSDRQGALQPDRLDDRYSDQELSGAVDDPELNQLTQGPESQVWLVLELCSGGNLQDSNCEPKTRFDMGRLICRLHEVALGMEFLHAQGIMHGDLKAANVLLKNTIYGRYGQIAKLSDFGMANILTDGATHRSTGRMGTITHQAPEVLERGHVSPSADVYSFGIMMWELFTGTSAFKNLHYGAVVQRVVVGGQRPPIPQIAPEEYCLLMTRCWDACSHARPTFKQIAECLQLMLDSQDSSTLDLRRVSSGLQLFGSIRQDDVLQSAGSNDVTPVEVELRTALPWPAAASIPVPCPPAARSGSIYLGSPAEGRLSAAVSDVQYGSLGTEGFAANEYRAAGLSAGTVIDSSARLSSGPVLHEAGSYTGGSWPGQAAVLDTVAEPAAATVHCSSSAGSLARAPITVAGSPLGANVLFAGSVPSADRSQRGRIQEPGQLGVCQSMQDAQQQEQPQPRAPSRLPSLTPITPSVHVQDL
eukprot:gene8299-8484_t